MRDNMLEVIKLGIKRLLIGVLVFLFAFSSLFINGCGKEPEKKPSGNAQNQASQKPKEPREIKDITKNIEAIQKGMEEKQESQGNSGQAQEQGKQSQGASQSQSGGNDQQKEQKDQGESGQKSGLEDWSEEEKAVKSIHEKWNSLETSAVKARGEDSLIMEFETNLDGLTNQVMEKSIMGTRVAANELYGSTVKIADLFQTNNPPSADMLKYYAEKSLLAIEDDNWAAGDKNIQDLKKQWEKVKTMLGKNKGELSIQMDYAISDFGQSINKKNKEVAKIKGEIVLANIEKIIKDLKEKQQQS